MKSISFAFLLCLVFNVAQAGFNGFTYHSRANCVNNESISWDATKTWHMLTLSVHNKSSGEKHTINSRNERTKRSAAVHWGEGTGGWRVTGSHYILDYYSDKITWMGGTDVTNCSIYDGWWDWDK